MPGPIAQTTAPNPPAAAHAKAEAAVTHSTSPPKHAPADTVVAIKACAFSARSVSDSRSGSAPPATWTYATRVPASAAQTGATWLCNEQQTTGRPPSTSATGPSSSAWRTACWTGV